MRAEMAATQVESFCERCGTKYTFDQRPERARRLKGLGRTLGFLAEENGLDEASVASRDPFHGTFRFCLECRQYTCPSCWNEAAGFCQGCVPLEHSPDMTDAEAFAAVEAASDIRYAMNAIDQLRSPDAWPGADLPRSAEPEPQLEYPQPSQEPSQAAIGQPDLSAWSDLPPHSSPRLPADLPANDLFAGAWGELLPGEDDLEDEGDGDWSALPPAERLAEPRVELPLLAAHAAADATRTTEEATEPELAIAAEAEPEPEPVEELLVVAEPEPVGELELATEPELVDEPELAAAEVVAEPDVELTQDVVAEQDVEAVPELSTDAEADAEPEPLAIADAASFWLDVDSPTETEDAAETLAATDDDQKTVAEEPHEVEFEGWPESLPSAAQATDAELDVEHELESEPEPEAEPLPLAAIAPVEPEAEAEPLPLAAAATVVEDAPVLRPLPSLMAPAADVSETASESSPTPAADQPAAPVAPVPSRAPRPNLPWPTEPAVPAQPLQPLTPVQPAQPAQPAPRPATPYLPAPGPTAPPPPPPSFFGPQTPSMPQSAVPASRLAALFGRGRKPEPAPTPVTPSPSLPSGWRITAEDHSPHVPPAAFLAQAQPPMPSPAPQAQRPSLMATPGHGKSSPGIRPCFQCGLNLSSTARFCRRCGTPQQAA